MTEPGTAPVARKALTLDDNFLQVWEFCDEILEEKIESGLLDTAAVLVVRSTH